MRRTLMLLGLSIFSVFLTHVIGFAGAGGLCTLVLAFMAALSWKADKVRAFGVFNQSKHLDTYRFKWWNPISVTDPCCSSGTGGSYGGPGVGCVSAHPLWSDWGRDYDLETQPQYSG